MSIKQSKYGRALIIAAKEAFHNEIVDTNMSNISIGQGLEWEDSDAWIDDRIATWIEQEKNLNE